MITGQHFQHASQGVFYNLLDNGAFTHHASREVPLNNTSEAFIGDVTSLVDLEKYKLGNLTITTGQPGIGSWVFSGAPCNLTIAPTDSAGNIITSVDGGNLLRILFNEDGTLEMAQSLPDPSRFSGVACTIAMTGVNFQGRATVSVVLVENDVETVVVAAGSSTFGNYRRLGASYTFGPDVTSVKVIIRIEGCDGEALGLSGIVAGLGVSGGNLPYVSSLKDRVLQPGTVIMFAGDACPPEYIEVANEAMALVSGVKSVVENFGGPGRNFGNDEHDHVDNVNALVDSASDERVETTRPIDVRQSVPTRGIPFGEWPASIPFVPFQGELPFEVLGPAHSHTMSTKMNGLPPTFPMKFCQKL